MVRVYDLSKHWTQQELFADLNFGYTVMAKDPYEAHYINSLVFLQDKFLVFNTDQLKTHQGKDLLQIVKFNRDDFKLRIIGANAENYGYVL